MIPRCLSSSRLLVPLLRVPAASCLTQRTFHSARPLLRTASAAMAEPPISVANSESGPSDKKLGDYDMGDFPIERIRNFSIVAHIGTTAASQTGSFNAAPPPQLIPELCLGVVDHGKSTLADRLLEITGTIRKDRENQQVLDKLKVCLLLSIPRGLGPSPFSPPLSIFWAD